MWPGWMDEIKDGGKEKTDRQEIRAISLHPSGIMIKDERKVMDGKNGMIGGGGGNKHEHGL